MSSVHCKQWSYFEAGITKQDLCTFSLTPAVVSFIFFNCWWWRTHPSNLVSIGGYFESYSPTGSNQKWHLFSYLPWHNSCSDMVCTNPLVLCLLKAVDISTTNGTCLRIRNHKLKKRVKAQNVRHKKLYSGHFHGSSGYQVNGWNTDM